MTVAYGSDPAHERAVRDFLLAEVERLRPTVGAKYDARAQAKGSPSRWSLAAYARMHGIYPAWRGEDDHAWRNGAGWGDSVERLANRENSESTDAIDDDSPKQDGRVSETLWNGTRQRHNGTLILNGLTSEADADALHRFLSHVATVGECEVWTGGAKFRVDVARPGDSGLRTPARWRREQDTGRRLMQSVAVGQRCGNRWCVRSEHLYEYPNRPGNGIDQPVMPSGDLLRVSVPRWAVLGHKCVEKPGCNTPLVRAIALSTPSGARSFGSVAVRPFGGGPSDQPDYAPPGDNPPRKHRANRCLAT